MHAPKVDKFFNTAGPGISEDHYMLDPLRRINYDEIRVLIDQKRYFILHAPRQTGKTTSLLAMVQKINEEGVYHCVYVNVESAQTARNDVEAGMKVILSSFASASEKYLGMARPREFILPLISEAAGPGAQKGILMLAQVRVYAVAQPGIVFANAHFDIIERYKAKVSDENPNKGHDAKQDQNQAKTRQTPHDGQSVCFLFAFLLENRVFSIL